MNDECPSIDSYIMKLLNFCYTHTCTQSHHLRKYTSIHCVSQYQESSSDLNAKIISNEYSIVSIIDASINKTLLIIDVSINKNPSIIDQSVNKNISIQVELTGISTS